MDQPKQPSWWNRNWKWFVPVGCLSSVILLAAFIAVIMIFVFGLMKSSDAYKLALDKAKSSPEVIEALGTPIREGYFTSGNINVSGPSGNADLAIPISGPKGGATIYLEAQKSAGEWSFSKLIVEIKGSRKRINLIANTRACLTPSSTRTSPALSSAPSLHSSSSAPLSASVQAGPVSSFR